MPALKNFAHNWLVMLKVYCAFVSALVSLRVGGDLGCCVELRRRRQSGMQSLNEEKNETYLQFLRTLTSTGTARATTLLRLRKARRHERS
jgi:hypothetical protein